MTSTSATIGADSGERPAPPFPSALVEDMLKLLVKAVRAHQLYLPNNPVYQRAVELVAASLNTIWEQAAEITLSITETDLVWEGKSVLAETEKGPDSIPWLFYKDGVRRVILSRGFETEIVGLLDIIRRVRTASPEEDDLLTMLWEKDFAFLRYQYVDLALEPVAPMEDVLAERATTDDVSGAVQRQVDETTSASRFVDLSGFDSTLYFLDEHEVEYLNGEIRKEYESDLRRNVLSSILDIFEVQNRPDIREEICQILDSFMLYLLSAGHFRVVAYLLRETAVAAQRAYGVQAEHRDKLAALPDRLSDASALSQLLQSLDEASELPPQEDLNDLFEQLRASALRTAFQWLSKLQNVQLKMLLETAAARLGSANTGELVRLITDSDPAVAIEAVRRAGQLRTPAAVPACAKLLAEGEPVLRLEAVRALSEIGSPGALQALEKALEDGDRDVRLTAVKVLAARTYRPALPKMESMIKRGALRESDLTERMAVFEAYGALCGDAGVPMLDEILQSRGGLLSRGQEPELRACAAMALGRVGTPKALDSLRRASNDKEVLVRNAVNRALRGGGA